MITLLLHLLRLLPFLVGGHRQLALENLALRQQLSVYKRTATRPKLRTTDRLFKAGSLARASRPTRDPLTLPPRAEFSFGHVRAHALAGELMNHCRR